MAGDAAGAVGDTGRANQRTRTRVAIVAATEDLLRAGKTPSVGEIAEAALVSRRTVYSYYPTLDQLLLDATLGLLTQTEVDEAIDAAPVQADPAAGVAALIEALASRAADTLPLGRSLVRLTLAQPVEQGGQRRGHRRVEWIERALQPLRPRLSDAVYSRLVSALCLVIGWEALIVLSDVRGLTPEDRTQTSLWAARALIEAALTDPPASRADRRPGERRSAP